MGLNQSAHHQQHHNYHLAHHNNHNHHNHHHHHHQQHHNSGPRRSVQNILEHGILHETLHHGRKSPTPLEPEEEDLTEGTISAKQFHNFFYDGFYAPYILNPVYMLLVDCRSEDDYNRCHVVTAHWHGSLDLKDPLLDLSRFSLIILYDEDGLTIEGMPIRTLQSTLAEMNVKLEPVIVVGGFEAISKRFPYMMTKLELTSEQRQTYIHWYPSIIEDESLYLGRAEHALSSEVVENLGITHIVNLTANTPNVFSNVSYLCFPVTDSKDSSLATYFLEIAKRIEGIVKTDGRVLVHCHQGVNASAAVIIAYLMHMKNCTLEDAHYYVKSLRPIIQPSEFFLEQLSKFEHQMFGRRFTSTDDLWF